MSAGDGAPHHGLAREAIGFGRIIFFVIAAAAPLSAALGVIPIVVGVGNGIGAPIVFVAVGLLLALFSVGYGRMAARVRNAGAFYGYVSEGLGRAIGIGAALVALASYFALQIGFYALFGIFAAMLLDPFTGGAIGWSSYAAVALLLVHVLGRRGVELNGSLLGVLMVLETIVVLLPALAIVVQGGGPDGLTLRPFDPALLLAPGAGIGLIFGVACFIGFEATAIYAEEARDPDVTVPRATYGAVAAITLFFTFVSWAIVCAHGLAGAQAAARADPSAFWFSVTDRVLWPGYSTMLSVLLLASTFAGNLAFHNMITRYLFALGRAGIIWRGFGLTHPVRRSPHVASNGQSAIALVLLAGCVLAGARPYEVVFSWGGAFGTIGIIGLQLLVCIAVIAFFRRERGAPFASTVLAPAVSALGLAAILWLALRNLDTLSGSRSLAVWALPIVQLLLFAGGTAWGLVTGGKRTGSALDA